MKQPCLLLLPLLLGLVACAPLNQAQPVASTVSIPGSRPTPIVNRNGMTMVYIPAGEFLMGSDDSDPAAEPDEKPQHLVFLNAFWIDRTEVTQAMYARCIHSGSCDNPLYWNIADLESSANADYPIAGITWDMARSYCEWAGQRLPSEAEWEKAARGTDGRLYPWGNTPPKSNRLNFKAEILSTSNATTARVGNYPSGTSPYGALDMAGNVWEWVADWYSDTYYAHSPRTNPPGPATGAYRACRGGSWNSMTADVRVAVRGMADPQHCDGLVGVRCALDASQ